jgi:hypothetical protein
MFFASVNLVSNSLAPCVPWEFKITTEISLQIRKDKESRQEWYKTESTVHNFYTGLEPLNPNLRISRENNPPILLSAFVADYDVPISDERAAEVIKTMPVKPTYVERSLGGNLRLIWILTTPIRIDSYEFCVFLLDRAVKFLSLELLPGLDEPAFKTPTRLYCNGGEWKATGFAPVPHVLTQAFLVDCAKRFRWPVKEETTIPLDVVHTELLKKYPSMDWPSEFALDSSGPSFWVEGSLSSNSALVKPGGMYSFAGHAVKPFTPWDDSLLLGSEFCKQFKNESISKATTDIFFDSRKYWRKFMNPRTGDAYLPMEARELTVHLKVTCKLSIKPGPSGCSQVEEAMDFIHNNNRIAAALPFAFHRPGILYYQGEAILNTYNAQCIQPAPGEHQWGPQGTFPNLSAHFDTFFSTPEQLGHFLAWWRYLYYACLNYLPLSGQNIFLFGGVGIGKTMTGRMLVGGSVGGFADASDFLINDISFNAHLFKQSLWTVDDESPSNTESGLQRFLTLLKKFVANSEFLYNEKFLTSHMMPWNGRVIVTANLDFISSRALSGMDNSSLDKTHLFKCVSKRDFVFPPRAEWAAIVKRELPCLLSWLLNTFKVPDYVKPDSRYGFLAHHEQSLLDQGYQTSKAAGFKECFIKTMDRHFIENPEIAAFEGTSVEILQMMKAETGDILKANVDTVNRSMDIMMKENSLNITTHTSAQHNLRTFRVPRFNPAPVAPATTTPPATTAEPNKFQA